MNRTEKVPAFMELIFWWKTNKQINTVFSVSGKQYEKKYVAREENEA